MGRIYHSMRRRVGKVIAPKTFLRWVSGNWKVLIIDFGILSNLYTMKTLLKYGKNNMATVREVQSTHLSGYLISDGLHSHMCSSSLM
jgi:hypothetical protein